MFIKVIVNYSFHYFVNDDIFYQVNNINTTMGLNVSTFLCF